MWKNSTYHMPQASDFTGGATGWKTLSHWKVGIPFWMYYPSVEVHRIRRLAGRAAGVSPARIVQSGIQK